MIASWLGISLRRVSGVRSRFLHIVKFSARSEIPSSESFSGRRMDMVDDEDCSGVVEVRSGEIIMRSGWRRG